jgi:hypothetical protein
VEEHLSKQQKTLNLVLKECFSISEDEETKIAKAVNPRRRRHKEWHKENQTSTRTADCLLACVFTTALRRQSLYRFDFRLAKK